MKTTSKRKAKCERCEKEKFIVVLNWCHRCAKKIQNELNESFRYRVKLKPGGARQKGHSFERECAIVFREFYPEARRLLENHRDDAKGVDLMHTGRLRIQCKRYSDYVGVSRITEIQCDPVIAGEIPLLITSGDLKPPMVVMGLSDFRAFLRDLQAAGTLP